MDKNFVREDSPSALCCLQAMLQTQHFAQPNIRRLLICDKVYTRHVLARKIYSLTDVELKLLGTVRMNLIDSANRQTIKSVVDKAKSAARRTWWLCQGLNSNSTGNEVSEIACFIVFEDRTVVVFYCNDLASVLSKLVHEHIDEFSIQCVHGLALLPRWI